MRHRFARNGRDPSVRGDQIRVRLDATPLLGRPTGVGVFCRGALEGLATRADVGVAAFAVSWRLRRHLDSLLPPGVVANQRPMPARPLLRAWALGDLPPVEWFVGACDVVHGTNFVVPPTRAAVPVVTIHDLTIVRFPELCDPATLAFPSVIRRAIRRGAWIHTPSDFVAGEVVEAFGANPERVRAVHSGTPGPPSSSVGSAQSCAGGTRGPYVLAIGTAEPRKDLPGLVAAFNLLADGHPDVSLVLCGPQGWGSADLDRAVRSSPFHDRVVQTGWVDEARLATLLRGAAVLAYPSVYEGFGFPPLQAMAAGVPVVATAAGSLPEVLGSAADLVPVGDPVALAGALGKVLEQSDHRDALITGGRAWAARYTWERCAEGLVAVYRDALESRSR